MENEKRQLTQNCGSSASDELLILIERLSVKGEDLKSAVTRGRLRAIRDPLCYQGFHLRPLAWLLMFARVGLQSWGAGRLSWVGGSFPGQWQTLHLILIITMHHQQIALGKTRPIFRDSLEDEKQFFCPPVRIVCLNCVDKARPHGRLLEGKTSLRASWGTALWHLSHRHLWLLWWAAFVSAI